MLKINLIKLFPIFRSNVKVSVMVQVEKVNSNGKDSVCHNLQRVSTVHDWESYKIKDVFDDGTMTFFWYIYTSYFFNVKIFIYLYF